MLKVRMLEVMIVQNKEQQVLFMFGPAERHGDSPMLVFAIPEAAWEYMKDGHTHEFDLEKVGIPLKVMLFGARDHQHAKDMIALGAQAGNITVQNRSDVDLHFDPKED